MKCSRKYIYLILLLLLLLIIVPNISPKNRRPSNATITESSTKIMDENRIHLSENNSSTEETIFISPETEAQAEIETSQAETERPQAIEGILGYKDADSFPEDMVFASEESIGLLTDIYEEIGFKGEYQSGDETVYNFYKQKFALLLEGKVKMYDYKGDESILNDRYTPMRGYKDSGCVFYFFDMDEDGAPELCVQGVFGTYVCKYNVDSNQYTEWWGTTNSGCYILGTRRISDDRSGDTERLFLLNKDGYTELKITFNISYRPKKKYLVSVPQFEERVGDGQIPDSMKQQVLYDEFWGIYYLRVTQEQYEELISGLHEAEKSAEKEQVPLSYFFDPGV